MVAWLWLLQQRPRTLAPDRSCWRSSATCAVCRCQNLLHVMGEKKLKKTVKLAAPPKLAPAAARPLGRHTPHNPLRCADQADPELEHVTFLDLPDPLILQILAVHPEACFDCTSVNRRVRRVSLEAAGALAAQGWAVRLAAERGHVAALQALLDGGADVTAELGDASAAPPLPSGTALHCAARNGRAGAVQLLLDAGSAVDAVTDDG